MTVPGAIPSVRGVKGFRGEALPRWDSGRQIMGKKLTAATHVVVESLEDFGAQAGLDVPEHAPRLEGLRQGWFVVGRLAGAGCGRRWGAGRMCESAETEQAAAMPASRQVSGRRSMPASKRQPRPPPPAVTARCCLGAGFWFAGWGGGGGPRADF